MRKAAWELSLPFALGVLLPFAFEFSDWGFWLTAILGNILILARDCALQNNH